MFSVVFVCLLTGGWDELLRRSRRGGEGEDGWAGWVPVSFGKWNVNGKLTSLHYYFEKKKKTT